VTIVEMMNRLAQSEEPEISSLLEKELRKRVTIYTNTQAEEIIKDKSGCVVAIKNSSSGKVNKLRAERIMMAVGRRSNADLLKVENTGVEVDKRGFIKVDEYLRTTRRNIYAIGDANGQQMFTHVANKEAAVAWYNSNNRRKIIMDYYAAPHAVYSYPQIASVGMTEEDAKKEYHAIIGRAKYSETAKGEAMMEKDSFAKIIVDAHSGYIMGFHIIGPYAPILIQEVVDIMALGGTVESLAEGIHIHPALSELIQRTLENLEEYEEHEHH
jgi:dihydrolipoamide dehydrogenase